MFLSFLGIFAKAVIILWAVFILLLITSLLIMIWLDAFFRLKGAIRNAK